MLFFNIIQTITPRNILVYYQNIANILGIVHSLLRPRGQFLWRIRKQWSNFSLESRERRTGIPNADKITSNHREEWFSTGGLWPTFGFRGPKNLYCSSIWVANFIFNSVLWVANYQRLRTTDLELQYINSTVINLEILFGIKSKQSNWVSKVFFIMQVSQR